MATKIVSKGNYAVTLVKMAINSGLDMNISNGLLFEAGFFGCPSRLGTRKRGCKRSWEKVRLR